MQVEKLECVFLSYVYEKLGRPEVIYFDSIDAAASGTESQDPQAEAEVTKIAVKVIVVQNEERNKLKALHQLG